MLRGLVGAFLDLDDLIRETPDDELIARRRDFAREILETRVGSIDLCVKASALWFEEDPLLCHRCFWTLVAKQPITRRELESSLRDFRGLAAGARVPDSVVPLAHDAAGRNSRARPAIDAFLSANDLPPSPDRAAPEAIDESVEIATDGGVIGIGSFESIFLFRDTGDPSAARKHRLLAFDTEGDGIFTIRVRTGSEHRSEVAPVRVTGDAVHLFGIGFLSREIPIASGDYAASIVRSRDATCDAILTLERVSKAVRWPFGNSFPAPFAPTKHEIMRLYAGR